MSNPILFGPAISPNMTYAERQAYRRDILNLPGPVDRWLIANSRSPRISFLRDYLLLTDVKREYVICFIESVRVSTPTNSAGLQQPDMYSLYITAQTSLYTSSRLLPLQSPRALLDRFIGFNDALDAPDWTRRAHLTLEFQQPKATFAALFVQMANWPVNKDEVGLPYQMAQWARSVMIDFDTAISKLQPPATPPSLQQVTNASAPKKQAIPYSSDINHSPTPSKSRSASRIRKMTARVKVKEANAMVHRQRQQK